jgi:hypothetical protein
MIRLAVCLLLMTSCGTSCNSNRQATVEGIWIAQADGITRAPEGATIAIEKNTTVDSLPDDDVVRLAIARDVLWSQVRGLRKQIEAAGKTPVLLVASDRKVGAIELFETLEGDPINVFVSVGGKLCVAPPGSPEAKCVQRGDKLHVDRAFTRELVREAVNAYGLRDVLVDVPADLEWADVVRSVDGARTAFFHEKTAARVRVRLK